MLIASGVLWMSWGGIEEYASARSFSLGPDCSAERVKNRINICETINNKKNVTTILYGHLQNRPFI